jgi:hypothetical protein
MTARALVVRPGDRMSASGRYVAREDGDWLDVALVDDLLAHPSGWLSSHSFRVVGLDPAAVPTDWGPDNRTLPGRVRVTGGWDGETITVQQQAVVRRPDWVAPTFRPPCPPPDGGWDTTAEHRAVPELESLRASGAIAVDRWMCEDGGAVVLIVAASDVELVHAVLDPRLPRRLCVIASRYSTEHVREVRDVLRGRGYEWGVQICSPAGLAADGQPHAHADLLRVSDDIADWADTLPDGLLDLRPIMTPA